ncbi:MAG TPA: hypothetical protein H9827_04515 [Candidatus Luteimonas excrementigallinarum]|nr:hypothetical protein [Candidatus Luteimonas excrementigallinarum]
MRVMRQKRSWAALIAASVLLVSCAMLPQAPRHGSLAWFITNVAADEEGALRDAMTSMDYDWAHDPHGRGPSLDLGDARIDDLFGVPYSHVFFLVKPEPCFPAAFVMEQFPELERRSDKWMQAFTSLFSVMVRIEESDPTCVRGIEVWTRTR